MLGAPLSVNCLPLSDFRVRGIRRGACGQSDARICENATVGHEEWSGKGTVCDWLEGCDGKPFVSCPCVLLLLSEGGGDE